MRSPDRIKPVFQCGGFYFSHRPKTQTIAGENELPEGVRE
jgi:hypothetical protein